MVYKNDWVARIAALSEGETLSVDCSVDDIVSATSELKRTRTTCAGMINLTLVGKAKGLNCRKIDKTDSRKVYNTLKPLCRNDSNHPSLAMPFIDTTTDSIVATDGILMVAMDKPVGLVIDPKGKDVGMFYRNFDEHTVSWQSSMGSFGLDDSDYALLEYAKIEEIKQGGSIHNLLAVAALCERKYAHIDSAAFGYTTIRLDVGGKKVSPSAMLKVICAIFRMGCTSIDVYSQRTIANWGDKQRTPLRLVGRGADIRITGLLMPFRSVSSGLTIVFPSKEKERDAA